MAMVVQEVVGIGCPCHRANSFVERIAHRGSREVKSHAGLALEQERGLNFQCAKDLILKQANIHTALKMIIIK